MTRSERSDEAWAWYTAVYEAVQEIPYGKVCTYGHIAKLLGKPQCPRQVGVCLKHLPSASRDPTKKSPTWHSGNVPWQRVINSKGGISPRGPSGASRQAAALRAEGVEVNEGAMGELSVDLQAHGWFPAMLPSEEELAEGESSEEDEDEEAAAYHT
ncbi:DNA binding methylated-DNA--cysteine S-methyltransferase [Periconia macrospinosa]|uniref:DNA binding methylated-DNA--cysteine S-methyltransferase n=1 Tax=Periconia macrospinosa TaxID=97972 RepID=A0A2V1E6H2_9PLEO|nr:DNA binding methylated-DNA--cysteine S-methyltransferase [Periconia macrospinosa]